MKKIIITLFLFFTAFSAYSQDYLDSIATKACECLNNTSDTLSKEQLLFKFGICVMEGSKNFKNEIKRDFKIDVFANAKSGKEFGEIIGKRLVLICPDVFMKVITKIQPNYANAEDEKDTDKSNDVTIMGVISKVDKDGFVVISVKDETGKIAKYYWLTFVESNFDLINNYNNIVGKKVHITYEPYEFFDPKLDEYRNFSIIKKIDFVTN